MPRRFGANLIALTVLLAAGAHAQDCNSLLDCYTAATKAQRAALLVRYSWDSPPFDWFIATMSCSFQICQEVQPGAGERVLTGALWRYHREDFAHGQGLMVSNKSFDSTTSALSGYATIPVKTQLRTGGLSLGAGFTIEATAFVSVKDNPATLLEVSSGDRSILGVEWSNGQMQIRRKATNDASGEAGFSLDRPWDMDMDFILHGIEPFRRSGEDPFPGLIEIYLTFTPDGKLKIDLVNVNDTSADQQITHLLDMGFPVAEYPQQTSQNPPWTPARYQEFDRITIGGRLPGTPHVLQLIGFQRPLTSNEILGFHSRNVFFGGTGRSSVAGFSVGQQPCNSGNFLNFPPGQFITTPCGKRDGQGPMKSVEPRENE